MSWHPIAAAAVLATSLTGAAAQAPLPADPGVEVLAIERERFQRMTVSVTIQGQGPFDFMIDTGAQATVLSRALAERLQLNDRGRATLVGMASSKLVETTPIDDFTLGSRSFYIRQAPVVEGEHIGGADGILGLDSLQDQRVLLDFAKREIAVADAEQLGGNRGYEIVVKARERLGQLIITSARLDGVQVAVIVDTGAQGSVGNLALLDRLRRNRQLADTEMTDVNGHTLGGVARERPELPDPVRRFAPVPCHGAGGGTGTDPRHVRAEAVPPRGDRLQDAARAFRPAAQRAAAKPVRYFRQLTFFLRCPPACGSPPDP